MKQEKNIWEQSRVELFQKLDCRETGLSQEDAALRLLKYGANELHAGKQKSILQIFLGQFADFLVLILILAAVISACMGDVESMIVILAVITMNAILGTVQTVKASASLDSLKQMSAPTAKVLRDGQIVQIPGREVVPGDVVILEAGDSVCADGRLLECASLKCAESALTGESLPVEKDTEPLSGETALGDRKNMVFSGSFVTYGRGRFLVTATGMDTEMGKIAQLLKNTEERKTPLQVSLDQFGRKLSIIILVICAVLFGVSVLWRHENVMNAFLFAVALAVAAIPEALSSIVTIVLSFGTRKMAKENAIIRHLQAVEGLGSVSVICSDKTGTLTQNRMTVRKLYTGGEVIDAKDADFRDPLQEPLLRTALLCSDAVISGDTEIGDPTETALVRLGETNGFDEDLVRDRWPRLTEIPFDSDRKMMSTVHKLAGGLMLVTKGATDVLLDRCVVTPEERTRIEQVNEQFSNEGLRVLAFACRSVDGPAITLADENSLTFLGLIAMMDPPREESKAAVAECIRAGIRPIMITGDHKITAAAIAREIGILRDGTEAVEGAVIDGMSDEELLGRVQELKIMSRARPLDKQRLVKLLQQRGEVVAVTGDGTNDAPALNFANVGLSMGSGTSVAKDASDITLLDDSFASIATAVMWGRSLYRNIQRFVLFQLTINFAAITICFIGALFGTDMPLTVVQILWVNIIMDTFAAMAMASLPPNPEVMRDKPRPRDEFIITPAMARTLFTCGAAMVVVLLGMLFRWTILQGGLTVEQLTVFFSTFVFLQFWNMFNAKGFETRHSVFTCLGGCREFFLILAAIGVGQVLIVEFGGEVFRTEPLSWMQWAEVIGFTSLLAVGGEIIRAIHRKRKQLR